TVALSDREIILSPELASELGSEPGKTVLLRIEKPSAIPAGSLHGRKEDLSRTIRLTRKDATSPGSPFSFSLRPQQGSVHTAFVSIARLQKDLDLAAKANTILLAQSSRSEDSKKTQALLEKDVRDRFEIEDLGLKLRALDDRRAVALESESAVIGDS